MSLATLHHLQLCLTLVASLSILRSSLDPAQAVVLQLHSEAIFVQLALPFLFFELWALEEHRRAIIATIAWKLARWLFALFLNEVLEEAVACRARTYAQLVCVVLVQVLLIAIRFLLLYWTAFIAVAEFLALHLLLS